MGNVSASLRTLLVGERTALNILQRTCGIATLAARAADVVKGSRLRILDTRKTSPGMRGLSKEAVRAGGASNHRFGLFDGVLIKDNHIAAVGGDVREALRRARAHAPQLVKIEIEVTGLAQLPEAIAGGADVVLLDNMDDATVAEAVRIAAGRVKLEVSGKRDAGAAAEARAARRGLRVDGGAHPLGAGDGPVARDRRELSRGVLLAESSCRSLHPVRDGRCRARFPAGGGVCMRFLVLGLLLAVAAGCASTRICGGGSGPGGCYEPATGKSTDPPTTTGSQKDDDLRRQISGRP